MSRNFEAEQEDLRDLVKRAAVKERRILRSSMVFSSLAVIIGLIWIGYSVNRVVKLSSRSAELQSTNKNLELSIQRNQEWLRQIEAKILLAQSDVIQEKGNAEAVANTALAALSGVQKDVQVAINTPSTVDPLPSSPSQAPTPTRRVSVPNLKGRTFADANKVLLQAGLQVIKTDQEGRGTPGTVLYQDPAAGVFISEGGSVKLYVAKETSRVMVPNVKGLTSAAAEERLRAARLTVIKEDQKGGGTPGTVLYQDPIPGAFVRPGTTVKLYVKPR
jgi:hypothetical protein